MNYLEAIAIKRLRPDSLPPTLTHLLDDADRVINRHLAIQTGKASHPELLPALSVIERDRMNTVLICRLAEACGRLDAWGGKSSKTPPIKTVEMSKADDAEHEPGMPA